MPITIAICHQAIAKCNSKNTVGPELQEPQRVQSATQLVLQLQLHSWPGLLPGRQLQLQQPQLACAICYQASIATATANANANARLARNKFLAIAAAAKLTCQPKWIFK